MKGPGVVTITNLSEKTDTVPFGSKLECFAKKAKLQHFWTVLTIALWHLSRDIENGF